MRVQLAAVWGRVVGVGGDGDSEHLPRRLLGRPLTIGLRCWSRSRRLHRPRVLPGPAHAAGAVISFPDAI